MAIKQKDAKSFWAKAKIEETIFFLAFPLAFYLSFGRATDLSFKDESPLVERTAFSYFDETMFLDITEGWGGMTTESIDLLKILFPCKEIELGEGDNPAVLGEINEINGHKTYIRFLDFKKKERVSFAIGYIEGCPEGCHWNNEESCLEACANPNNWREEKRFISEDETQGFSKEGTKSIENYLDFLEKKIQAIETLSESETENEVYYGRIIKLDDPTYITSPYYLVLPKGTLGLKSFGTYSLIKENRDPEDPFEFKIVINEDTSLILFP